MSNPSVPPPARPVRRHARLAGFLLALAVGVPIALPSVVSAESDNFYQRGSGSTTGAWLVTLRPDVDALEAAQLLTAAGASEVGSLSSIAVRVVDVPLFKRSSAMGRLASDPRVLSVELDAMAEATLQPKDPRWDKEWGLRRIRAPEAWQLTTGARDTIIAVVDTGVDANQPDLRGRVLRGKDFHNNDKNAADDNGHGTAVAGVAAAAGNNGVGIAGLCWKCRILPVKVLNSNGSGSHSNIAAGIIWAANHGADVINLSLATPTRTNVMANAVAYARRRGSVVVAAAGNEGSRRKYYPAALPGVLSVAATNGSDSLYRWSNRGSWIKLAAPGCAYTTKRGRSWSRWCGTSFAAPAVAGTVALVKSLRPGMSRSRLESTVLGNTVRIRTVLRGRLDAARALRSANATRPTTPPTVPPPTPPETTDHNWRGELSPDDLSDRKSFWLAGEVKIDVDWSGDTSLWLKVVDSDGKTVVRRVDDEEIQLELDLLAGDYRLTVGERYPAVASYRIQIDQGD